MPRRNSGMMGAAAPGLSKLAAALAGGGDQAYQQSYEGELGLQSKLAQAMAAARAHDAAASASTARAAQDNAETSMLQGRPALVDELMANGANTDVPMVQAIRRFTQTGQRPQVPMGPPTEEGAMGVGGQQFDPQVQTAIGKMLARYAPALLSSGPIKVDDWAKAQQLNREGDLSDSVIADPTKAGAVFKGQAAAGAKPLFHTDSSGAVLDQGTGSLETANPMATSTIGLRGAQAKQATAGAAEHYAGAGEKNAKAQQIKAGGGASGKAPAGYAWGPTDEDGQRTLVPIAGGPADKSAKLKDIPPQVNAKIIEGRQGLNNIDAAIEAIQQYPDALGFTNAIPGAQSARQVTDPKGVAARAKVANIGSLKLHDRSGAAVSASEFPRLAPFIPSASDRPAAAISKLQEMKRIAEEELGLFADTYSQDSGYKPSPLARPAAGGQAPAAAPSKAIAPTNAKGWALHRDAQGNTAYVSPDGKQFEEVR